MFDGQTFTLFLQSLLFLDAAFLLELTLALFFLEAEFLGQGFLSETFLFREAYNLLGEQGRQLRFSSSSCCLVFFLGAIAKFKFD